MGRNLALVAGGLLALAFVIRLLAAQTQAVWVDELYHVIAGRSLNAGKGFALYEGVYTRVAAFTALVSAFISSGPDNMLMARMPAVLAGSILVAYVYIYVLRTAGFVAALSSALFVCFSSVLIEHSAYVRFYSIQSLLFTVGALLIFDGLTKLASVGNCFRVAAAISFLSAALYVQVTTVFGMVGIVIWAAAYAAFGPYKFSQHLKNPKILLASCIIIAAISTVLAAFIANKSSIIVGKYLESQQWNRTDSSNDCYYVLYIWDKYKLLCLYAPFAFLLSFRVNGRLSTYLTITSFFGILFLSFGGMKTPRYLTFVLPAMFIICGMAVAGGHAWLQVWAAGSGPANSVRSRWTPGLAVIGAIVAIFAFDQGLRIPVRMALQDARRIVIDDRFVVPPPPDEFRDKRLDILAAARDSQLFVTTDEFRSILYLGGYDVALTPGFGNGEGLKEFSRDRRTGRPKISSAKSLAVLMRCYASGLILVMNDEWPAPNEVDPDVASVMAKLPAPEILSTPGTAARVYLFRWRTNAADMGAECADIRRLIAIGHVPIGGGYHGAAGDHGEAAPLRAPH